LGGHKPPTADWEHSELLKDDAESKQPESK
jgi:hypothetical protein